MKVKVADLEPNPLRKMDSYPIDRAKVEALKTSITEKTFWDNILVRKHKDKYQLAYGHHRWVALKELGIKEIDIPVRDIDDATMLQIMAEENLNWSTSPAVTTQTVLAAKEFLDGELVKYETWEHADKNIRVIFASNSQFQQNKQQGVGRDTILKFLGGNWKAWMIQEALQILKDKDLSQKAIREIPTMEQAKVFRNVVKARKIDKQRQQKLAKKITKEGIGRRDIPEAAEEFAPPTAITKKQERKSLPNIIEFINKCETDTDNLNRRLNSLSPHLKEIVKNRRLMSRLVSALEQLNKTIEKITTEYGVEKKRKESVVCVAKN